MYALIDCNNFYASCERLFRPDLRDKPILILSNNDGCVIARSNEAKALGIKMGVPFFQVKHLCQQHKVNVFSSNYTLYGDISQRVMATIQENWPEVEIYSIDEAFLNLTALPQHLHLSFCNTLHQIILKNTGIPTSIGIGPTKTLAKVANSICKKKLNIPVFQVNDHSEWLKRIAVGEVWGIGRQWQKKLMQRGIYTAYDLASINPHLLKQQFNIVLMRTAMELQGIDCAGLSVDEPKQTIISSRSFGEMQIEYNSIAAAISAHCTRAWAKLRRDELLVQSLYVFVQTNRFREDLPQYCRSAQFQFMHPTDDLISITKAAKRCLGKLFKENFRYKKVGVCLNALIAKNPRQLTIFHQPSEALLSKKDKLMTVFETINDKYGQQMIRLAAEGYSKLWAMRAELKSPAYTTRWTDLAWVKTD